MTEHYDPEAAREFIKRKLEEIRAMIRDIEAETEEFVRDGGEPPAPDEPDEEIFAGGPAVQKPEADDAA